jgi:Domain of unknown function (DUF6532)
LRFLADIIIKSIAEAFYGKGRYGLALYHATERYFIPLPGTVVVVCCTQVYQAISEYESGQRKITRFEEGNLEGKWFSL